MWWQTQCFFKYYDNPSEFHETLKKRLNFYAWVAWNIDIVISSTVSDMYLYDFNRKQAVF